MALTVEDGTGLEDADSLASLADFKAWRTANGFTTPAADDPDLESALRRGSTWLSTYFQWKGSPLKPRVQALAFPRTGVTDCDGAAVADDEVPREVELALFVASQFEVQTPGGLTPTVNPNQQVKRVRVEGAVDVHFRDVTTPSRADLDRIDNSRPVLAAVQDHLRCLVTNIRPIPHPVAV